MKYYDLQIAGIRRKLPIVALGPKIKIASFNLLGDRKMVEVLAGELVKQLKDVKFDYLVGPEVKVVPLLHELSKLLGKDRYIICRKQIHGYMVSPISSQMKPGLVLDGSDSKLLKKKKVVLVDDVVSSGRTMKVVEELMEIVGAKVVSYIALFKQGDREDKLLESFIFLGKLPVFAS